MARTNWRVKGPTLLYRIYGADGTLLYVGVTCDWEERVRRHASTQPWWDEVEYVDFEPRQPRRLALAAERRAIAEERPLYNIAGVERA